MPIILDAIKIIFCYISWKRSECEKFLGQGITLPQNIKDKMQDKMAELAAAFLKDNL